jgi:uncharacterized lipoprotein YmbA
MRARGVAAVVAAAWLVVAAAGCLPRTAPSRFYVLAPTVTAASPAPPAGEGRPVAIGLGPVRLPAYVDRPQIVTRRGPDEVDLAEFDRWAEPLADSVPRTVAMNLGALLPDDRIALFPWAGSRSVQYQVVIEIVRFDGALGESAFLDARWRVLGPDRKDVREGHFAGSEPAAGPGYAAVVAAMSRALGALSRDIAAALRPL